MPGAMGGYDHVVMQDRHLKSTAYSLRPIVLYWGTIGIMDKKMEDYSIIGYIGVK